MKSLNNPYREIDGYNCFGCSPENPVGLKMKFFEDGEEIVSYWEPEQQLQGYFRVLHGGIQATLLDEIASWYVTSSMQIDYLDQVSVDGGTIELRAALESSDKKKVVMQCTLSQGGDLKARARCEYAVFSPKLAEKKLHYPGIEKFHKRQ